MQTLLNVIYIFDLQVVVPFLTKTYAQSNDAPDTQFPMCTLKSFPNLIQHTLNWARDMFEGVFTKDAQNAKLFMSEPTFLDYVMSLPGIQLQEMLESLEVSQPFEIASSLLSFESEIFFF